MSASKLPLEDVRVLDLTLVWAGPFGTRMLADWGAEVIRVEPVHVRQPQTRGPRARPTRQEILDNPNWYTAYPDWDPGPRPWNRHVDFNFHAYNKLGMSLNLTRPEGVEVLDKLVAVSDVLVENNVPETADKLGIDYERMKRINPGFIVIRMPGFGLDAPYKNFRCLGSHFDGICGHTWIRGYADMDMDVREDVYLSDAGGGITAALAVMMALRHRAKTGQGQLVELAQVENFSTYVGEITMDYRMNRRVPTTLGNRHPYQAPHGCYPCKGEDQWVTIAVSNPHEWDGLCKAMGNPSWTLESEFSSELARRNHQDELDENLGQWTKQRDKKEVMRLLQGHGVPAGAVLTQEEVHQDPQFKERDFFQELTQADSGTHLYAGVPVKLSRTPNSIRMPPVQLGEHNEYIYKELLGLTEAEYAKLEKEGNIGTEYPSHVP